MKLVLKVGAIGFGRFGDTRSYIYIYIYMYNLYIFTYIHIHLSLSLSPSVSLSKHIPTYMYLYIHIYVFMCLVYTFTENRVLYDELVNYSDTGLKQQGSLNCRSLTVRTSNKVPWLGAVVTQ